MRIAFDTQVVSYFLQANQSGYNPDTDPNVALAEQKVAAFCLWMYVGNPAIVPTVFAECDAITKDDKKKREHFNWNAYHFKEILPSWLDVKRVNARAAALAAFHLGANDCRIVAECEEPAAAVDALAAFDTDLIKHLASQSRVLIATPVECLHRAGVTQNSQPQVHLHPEHPLAAASWWKLSQVLRSLKKRSR